MVELLMPALGSTVALTIDVDPATSAVEVDEAELELALLNLAINARDAMPSGGKLEILARNAAPGEAVAARKASSS
jgi:signal transduction histidine kinase